MRIFNYFLGLGTNIEPRLIHLKNAVAKLNQYGTTTAKSSIYESEPWGYKEQSFFLNTVIKYDSELPPYKLLDKIKHIEHLLGREKSQHWGPRIIDIDILLCNQISIKEPDLKVPHEHLLERKFALAPLSEIIDSVLIDGCEVNTEALVQKCSDKSIVNKLNLNW